MMSSLALTLGGAAALAWYRYKQREGSPPVEFPAWVEEARRRGQGRYLERQAKLNAPGYNGADMAVIRGLTSTDYENVPRGSLAEALQYWYGISRFATDKDADFEVLTERSTEFRGALTRLEATLPEVKEALSCPAFVLPEATPQTRPPHPEGWLRTLVVALETYLGYLCQRGRDDDALSLAAALLQWTSLRGGYEHTGLAFMLVLQGWSLRAVLSAYPPWLERPAGTWEKLASLLETYTPDEAFFVECYEDELAHVHRWRQRSGGSQSFFDQYTQATACCLQRLLEQAPHPRDILPLPVRDPQGPQMRGYLADLCPLNRAAFRAGAISYRLLALRVRDGQLPDTCAQSQPGLYYEIGPGGDASISMDVPPNRHRKESRRFSGLWYGYREGRVHFHLIPSLGDKEVSEASGN